MPHEDEITNPDRDLPEDETLDGRRRTARARYARRALVGAQASIECIMEDYDVKDTQCLFTPEDGPNGTVVDGLSAHEVAALVSAHRVITMKIAELTIYLKDRA